MRMNALPSQAFGLVVLVAGIAFAWNKLAKPLLLRHGSAPRFVLATLCVVLVGGLAGAPFWFADYGPSFSWDLPPLASRLLGAAALAFGIAGIWVMRHATQSTVRAYLIMLLAYLLPIMFAATVLHSDRFDWRAPITPAFFLIVGGLSFAGILHLVRNDAARLPKGLRLHMPPWVRILFILVSILAFIWAAVLFLFPSNGPVLIATWPGDPLSSRLIGTMFFTIAVAALAALHDAERARTALVLYAVYGFGVVAAGIFSVAAGKPMPVAYVFGLGGLAAAAIAILSAGKLSLPLA